MKRKILVCLVAVMLLGVCLAHPHFTKKIVASVGTNELTLSYTTYPYNEEHLSQVQDGFVFHCGRATLALTGVISAAGKSIPAGEYLVRARANSLDSWTLVLVPSSSAQGSGNVDVTKGFVLESTTLTGLPESHHLDLDLYSGHGSTEGDLILSVSFGERKVEGALELG